MEEINIGIGILQLVQFTAEARRSEMAACKCERGHFITQRGLDKDGFQFFQFSRDLPDPLGRPRITNEDDGAVSKSYHVADTFNRVIDPDGSNRKTAEIQLHFRLDRPEADRGFFFIRNYGEVRPDGVVEKVLFQGVQDAFRADDGDRKIPAGTDIDVVRQEHDIAYMVQVGMGDEDMIDPGLFLHGKGGRNRPAVDQHFAIDQKTCHVVAR